MVFNLFSYPLASIIFSLFVGKFHNFLNYYFYMVQLPLELDNT